MEVFVTDDAKVLVPNKEHKNFTATDVIIPKGNSLEGEELIVNGLRRGQPFQYKLFKTKENQFIYLNKTKPNMANTQVFLGADSQQTPTIVDVPQAKLLSTTNIVGAIAGYFVGNFYSKKYQKGNPRYYGLAGAVAGVLVARYIAKKGTIKFVKSK
jgi:hypothetical protein